MKPDPMINDIASLISDSSRCIMLMNLLGGQRTAGELAKAASIKPQTATYHLCKMINAGIIEKTKYGRFCYFKLANEDVAQLLELLMKLSKSPEIKSLNQSIHSQTLRNGRLCYDHIAGKLGVKLKESLLYLGYISLSDGIFRFTESGITIFIKLGLVNSKIASLQKLEGKNCYDWSQKDYHISGTLGKAIAVGLIQNEWVFKSHESREIKVTEKGKNNLSEHFGIMNL